MKKAVFDERTEQINGLVSFFTLAITQVVLGGIIVYQRYFLKLPAEEYNELSWVLCLSLAIYWGGRLYFSGILPVISFKKMLAIYFISVAVICIPTYFIHGLPGPERWYEVLYPFLGVAVVIGLYSLIAYLGKRRIEKEIRE